MTLYMKTTTDELELPIAVADTPRELAHILGISPASVNTLICLNKSGYKKVEVGEPEWQDRKNSFI